MLYRYDELLANFLMQGFKECELKVPVVVPHIEFNSYKKSEILSWLLADREVHQ